MNPNLNIWLYSSTCKYFGDALADKNFFAENDVKNTDTLSSWVEFFFDGPIINEITANNFTVDFTITVAICFVQSDSINYGPQALEGLVQSLFGNIPIFRYGDDGGLLDCAIQKGKVKVQRLGTPGPGTRVLQSNVVGSYTMNLTGDA